MRGDRGMGSVQPSTERRPVERVVRLRTRLRMRGPSEVLLADDCVVAVYDDDRAVRFASLESLLRAHGLDVLDLEFEPD